jgi:hypothetical protein
LHFLGRPPVCRRRLSVSPPLPDQPTNTRLADPSRTSITPQHENFRHSPDFSGPAGPLHRRLRPRAGGGQRLDAHANAGNDVEHDAAAAAGKISGREVGPISELGGRLTAPLPEVLAEVRPSTLFNTWLTVAVDTLANRATSALVLVGRATSSTLTRTPPLNLNAADGPYFAAVTTMAPRCRRTSGYTGNDPSGVEASGDGVELKRGVGVAARGAATGSLLWSSSSQGMRGRPKRPSRRNDRETIARDNDSIRLARAFTAVRLSEARNDVAEAPGRRLLKLCVCT